MYCISVSYKKADINIRKSLAFDKEKRASFVKCVLSEKAAEQCVILCTCNRTEVYFCGGEPEKIKALLAEYAGQECESLSAYMLMFAGSGAVAHLFKVSCGIESMVMGEDEILGQTKSAYAEAKELGAAGYELNMIFQAAVTCAKKIKTETALSKTSVSTATLAANEAAKLGENVKVLVIGATGKIGMSAVKNLLSHKNAVVTVTARSHGGDLSVFSLDEKLAVVKYEDRYDHMEQADCIISATSGPHYTVTAERLKRSLKTFKPRLFIDLAVPPDIERASEKIEGARLVDIDYFERLAAENNALKLDSAEQAERIIKAGVETLEKELAFHDFMPCLSKVKSWAENRTVESVLYELRDEMNLSGFSSLLDVLKNLSGGEK